MREFVEVGEEEGARKEERNEGGEIGLAGVGTEGEGGERRVL